MICLEFFFITCLIYFFSLLTSHFSLLTSHFSFPLPLLLLLTTNTHTNTHTNPLILFPTCTNTRNSQFKGDVSAMTPGGIRMGTPALTTR